LGLVKWRGRGCWVNCGGSSVVMRTGGFIYDGPPPAPCSCSSASPAASVSSSLSCSRRAESVPGRRSATFGSRRCHHVFGDIRRAAGRRAATTAAGWAPGDERGLRRPGLSTFISAVGVHRADSAARVGMRDRHVLRCVTGWTADGPGVYRRLRGEVFPQVVADQPGAEKRHPDD
jgi:hypothetical protein